MPDCLSAGIIVADHVCEPIDYLPGPGELVLSPHMQLGVGGCATNVAVNLATLGVDVGVVGRIGHDVFGRFVQDRLTDSGVDCSGLSVSDQYETSGSLVINVRGEDRRFIHATGANAYFSGEEISSEQLSSTRILYLGGYLLMDALTPERAANLFRIARANGVCTLLDVVVPAPGDYWSRLKPVLAETDVFLPNNDEAELITGLSDPQAQGHLFRDLGATTVIITCGERGCFVESNTDRFRATAAKTDVIDGTGSGDAFVAGFIHGLLKSENLRQCVRLGSALGARTVASLGATGAAMNAAELDQALMSQPIEFHDLPD